MRRAYVVGPWTQPEPNLNEPGLLRAFPGLAMTIEDPTGMQIGATLPTPNACTWIVTAEDDVLAAIDAHAEYAILLTEDVPEPIDPPPDDAPNAPRQAAARAPRTSKLRRVEDDHPAAAEVAGIIKTLRRHGYTADQANAHVTDTRTRREIVDELIAAQRAQGGG